MAQENVSHLKCTFQPKESVCISQYSLELGFTAFQVQEGNFWSRALLGTKCVLCVQFM